MEGHRFRIYEGKYWCENEDVISEECTDYDRCNNECVCNKTEFKYVVTVTCEDREQADQVMIERIYFEEEYGFDYEVDFEPVEMEKANG